MAKIVNMRQRAYYERGSGPTATVLVETFFDAHGSIVRQDVKLRDPVRGLWRPPLVEAEELRSESWWGARSSCARCGGEGALDSSETESGLSTCPACHGTGDAQ